MARDWSTDPRLTVPDGGERRAALEGVSHAAVCAHPDDLEIMAYPAILACYDREDLGFVGVVLTSGSGSPRGGPHAGTSDAVMATRRAREQRAAAAVGRYAGLVQLGSSSQALRDDPERAAEEVASLLDEARPRELYLHNPFDRHPTHVAAFRVGLAALRRSAHLPERVLGCEVWGSLDWLPASVRVELDTGDRPHLAAALIGTFDSQIAGGRRYDLGAIGRWTANAVFTDPHAASGSGTALAVDLRPLADPGRSLADWVDGVLAEHAREVRARLDVPSGGSPWRS